MKNFKILTYKNIILGLSSLLLFLIFFSGSIGMAATRGIEDTVTEEEYIKNLENTVKMDGKDIIDRINSTNSSYYMFIGYKDCEFCRVFSPTIKELTNYLNSNQLEQVYYFDFFVTLSDEQKIIIKDYLKNEVQFQGTPTVLYVKNGTILGSTIGSNHSLQELIDLRNSRSLQTKLIKEIIK